MSAISLHCATGAAIEPYLADLARLRIHVFRHWPYLYEGSVDYEMQYLTTYLRTPRSICVMAQVDNEIVGASTGLPLSDETAEFQGPFYPLGGTLHVYFILVSQFYCRNIEAKVLAMNF